MASSNTTTRQVGVERKAARGATKTYEEGLQNRWRSLPDASPDHAYLAGHDLDGRGLKEWNGKVIVPFYNEAGELRALQEIDKDGYGVFTHRARDDTCFHRIGDADNPNIGICADYATGAAVHKATKSTDNALTMLVAGSQKFMEELINRVEAVYKETLLIFANDQPGAARNNMLAAAEAAGRRVAAGVLFPPPGKGGTPCRNFAAFAQRNGNHQVRSAVNKALAVARLKHKWRGYWRPKEKRQSRGIE